MKLIIQIPCLNEENTLPMTLAELPTHIDGVDEIEILVIDDGSTDRTAEVARAHGVHHVARHDINKGLATAFQTGLHTALLQGADIIVNTDADNQYPGRFIPDLVRPILNRQADMVIGDRQIDTIPHFSPVKKRLQKAGSWVVRVVSNTDVADAPSGFRAMTREAALRLNIFTNYTYTLETIIQAGKKNLTVVSVPIETNPKQRESRLIRSTSRYVIRSALTILRIFMMYEPLRSFSLIALPFAVVGMLLWLRYGVLWLLDETARGSNIQSITIGSALIIIAFLVFLIGLVGEMISINRRLHEETLYYLKRETLRKVKEGEQV
ncbi:MAG: glycosyltransferase family 2 protein [Anaerolineae bacterium]